MDQDINQKADRIISSFNGSKRAVPSPLLFDKIKSELLIKGASIVPLRTIWLSVAAAALLIFINIVAINNTAKEYTQSTNDTSASANGYTLISNYNIYEL